MWRWLLCSCLYLHLYLCCVCSVAAINPLPNENWETDRLDLENGGDKIFYYLVKSRQQSDRSPLVVWLDGGPGYSSAGGLFLHNGPYIFNESSVFMENIYAWTLLADVMYVDNPIGVGYSRARDPGTLCRNETCVAKNFFNFLVHFVESHPEYFGRPLYITGESYAGHYVPAISTYLAKAKHPGLNLKGCGVGNGLFDLYEQLPYYPEYLYANGNVSYPAYFFMKVMTLLCNWGLQYEPTSFDYACNYARDIMANYAGIKDQTDITRNGSGRLNMTRYFHYMNRSDVRHAFGMDQEYFHNYNPSVYIALRDDIKLSLLPSVGYLLDQGVKVLLYYGDKDYKDNWMVGLHIAEKIPWKESGAFNDLPFQPWKDTKGETIGLYKTQQNFTFVRVYNAGHCVFERQRPAGYLLLQMLLKA